MRIHVVSLPHTETTAEYCSCAYTTKVKHFAQMMHKRGHDVFLYAGEKNDAQCTEHVKVVTRAQQRQWFGEPNFNDFYPIEWDHQKPYWSEMAAKAALEIRRRARQWDLLCLISGAQWPIKDALPDLIPVEFGIGYEGTCCYYRAFESNAWRHHVHGLHREADGRNLDAVIPNYFDPDDFPFSVEKEDYYLFIGRLVMRKGPLIAAEVTRRLGARLLMAGQGVVSNRPGQIVAKECMIVGDHVKHLGHVGVEQRGKLMSKARAVFVPTQYIEPFGGVAVEANMCGTPVLVSNFGAFYETIEEGVTGYHCGLMSEYIAAAKIVHQLDPRTIRARAINRFSMDAVAPMYEKWFERVTEHAKVNGH